MFTKISNLYYSKQSKLKTPDESEYIKRIYNDEINITHFEIEVEVLRDIFYEKKVDCFDSLLDEIRKLRRD